MRKINFLLLLFLLSFFSCNNVQENLNYYVLSYGVGNANKYPKDKLMVSPLKNAHSDVILIKENFSKIEKINLNFYERYVNSDSSLTTEKLPTKKQLISDIEELEKIITKKDYFIFHYAGHGLGNPLYNQIFDFNENEDTKYSLTKSKEYLCLYLQNSISPDSWSNPSLVTDVLISDSELDALFSKIKTDKKIILLDCCNSGGFINIDNMANSNLIVKDNPFKLACSIYVDKNIAPVGISNAFILAASGEAGASFESQNINNGLMTYSFCESLKYGDYNNDSYIALSESFRYIKFLIKYKFKKKDLQDQLTVLSGSPIDIILFKKLN